MAKRLRIITGLILFAFLTMHLTNVALGLSSVALMEQARPWLLDIWANIVVGPVLLAALLIHMGLGLAAIYRRNTFNMTRNDIVQIVSSLILVPLMIPHVMGTAVAKEFFDLPQNFAGVLMLFWYYEPAEGLRQVLLLSAAWIHGCIGLFLWLRVQRWWPHVAYFSYPVAVALPVLAMLGYVEGGKQVMSGEVEVVYAMPPEGGPTIDEIVAQLHSMGNWLIVLFLLVTACVLVARMWRLMGNDGATRIRYAGLPAYTSENGLTLLESARTNEIPHASLCGGRGRCGTCRVRILGSSHPLPQPSEDEQRTLRRLGAGGDVRLACQLKIGGGRLEVARLLPPHVKPADVHYEGPVAQSDQNAGDGKLEAAE